MEKIRVYTASIMAFHHRLDMPDDGSLRDGTWVEHIPALIPAASIELAADRCRDVALERWKRSDEWYGHRAEIEPVTAAFYEAAAQAAIAGVVGEDNEEPRCFTFDE